MSGTTLEGRVAIVSDQITFSKFEKFAKSDSVKEFVHSPALDELTLNDFDAVVITKHDEVQHPALQTNFRTPVIFYAEPDSRPSELQGAPDEMEKKKQHFIAMYNLFEVVDYPTFHPSLAAAIQAKSRVDRYLQNNSEGHKILARQNPPQFRNALAVVSRYEKSLQSLDELNRELPIHSALWGTIQTAMFQYDITEDSKLAEKLAPVVASFLDSYPDYVLAKSVFHLGEGEIGEGGVAQVTDHAAYQSTLPFLVFREIQPRGSLPSKQIAEQRVKDAKHMYNRGPLRATPLILRPLHFEDFPGYRRNTSFVIMQYVHGIPLYKVLLQLNKEHTDEENKKGEKDENRQAKIHLLRKSLVEKYVDDCAFWLNSCTTTFVKKPSPNELVQYYRERIDDIPDAFTRRTTVSFTEKEKKLWSEATKVLGEMKMEERHIVRNLDSSLANIKLRLPKITMSIDDYFSEFGVTSREKIDMDKVDRTSYHVDMQYRYGHVLEDLSQIATFYEAAFVLRSKDGSFTTQNIFKMRDRFFDGVDNKDSISDLRNDNLTFYLMLWYRAVRKMSLFTDYWERTCEERVNEGIKKNKYEDRRLRFTDNITHHYLLARHLCHRLNHEFNRKYKMSDRINPFKIDSRVTPLTDTEVDACLTQLTTAGIPEQELNFIRTYALHGLLLKIGTGFSDERERTALKYCPPGKKMDYKEGS